MPSIARFSASLILVACLGGGSAAATTLMPMSQEQMVDVAELVVRGTVSSVQPVMDEDGSVRTRVTLYVEHSLKGVVDGKTLLIESPGGVMDTGEFTDVALAARYSVGEQVLVFLVSHRFGSSYTSVGMAAGKYTIKQNPATGADMVVRFALPYSLEYDARFIPNPPPADRISLDAIETEIEAHVADGWDGKPIPGISLDRLRAINKVQVK